MERVAGLAGNGSGVSAHPAYRPDIDGLRAVAVLSVVIFHAFPDVLPGGFVGVDVFFVISGYLISLILLGRLAATGRPGIADFYRRRIRRIFPSLLLVLSACLLFGWYALFPEEFRQLGKHTAAGAAFIANFALLGESGYFDAAAESKVFLHLWSLGIEEQFYIAWPLLLWLAVRFRVGIAAVIGLLLLASFAWCMVVREVDAAAAFYGPLSRAWELAAGALLAHASRRGMMPSVAIADFLSIAGLSLLVASLLLVQGDGRWPGPLALLPVTGTVLLILAGMRASINQSLLANPVAVWFGLISFPLYLWHWPLLTFSRVIEGGLPAVGTRILVVLVAVLLAWMTWRLVERPLRGGDRATLKVGLLFSAMIAVGGAGYLVWNGTWLPRAAHDAELAEYFLQFQQVELRQERRLCRARFPGQQGHCLTNIAVDDPRPPEFVFIGDSHSRSLGEGFLQAYPGVRTLVIGKGGCPPMPGIERVLAGGPEHCAAAFNDFLAGVQAGNYRDSVVVVSARYANYTAGMGYAEVDGRPQPHGEIWIEWAGTGSVAGREAYPAMVEQGLRDTLTLLVPRVRLLVFNNQVPELGYDPKRCIPRPFRDVAHACRTERAEVLERQSAYRVIAGRVLTDFPDVLAFDPLDVFCDKQYCHVMRGGQVMYRDDNHLSIAGASALSRAMLQAIGTAGRSKTGGPGLDL